MGPMNHMITAHRSQGFVLFMTLVMLVILTISGLAMMQVMGAGLTAAGNIAFRQASVRYADLALEDARIWLQGRTATFLHDNHPDDHGYMAWVQQSNPAASTDFDPLTHDWTNDDVAHLYDAAEFGTDPDLDGDGDSTTFSGYRIYYVIHRMANRAELACSVPTTGCMVPPPPTGGGGTVVAPGTSQSAGIGYTPPILGTTGNVYFRITAKVVGPRHSSSYVQAIMH
jgi:type IV pilus assembly protein PilX